LTQLIWLDFIRLYWWDEERIKACHARARRRRWPGRAGPWPWGQAGRQVGGERAGVAWFCYSPLIIVGVSTLLHYGEVGWHQSRELPSPDLPG
jgi:hypothetical protein